MGELTDVNVDNDISEGNVGWRGSIEGNVDGCSQEQCLEVELTLHVGQGGNSGVVWESWDHATASLESIAWARKGAEIWVGRGADVLELNSAVAVRSVGSSVAVVGARNGAVLVGHDGGAGDLDPAKESGWRVGAAEEVPVANSGWSSWDKEE